METSMVFAESSELNAINLQCRLQAAGQAKGKEGQCETRSAFGTTLCPARLQLEMDARCKQFCGLHHQTGPILKHANFFVLAWQAQKTALQRALHAILAVNVIRPARISCSMQGTQVAKPRSL